MDNQEIVVKFPKHPDYLWDMSRLLFSWWQGLFPQRYSAV
jgi:hypothetical protein